MRVALEFDFGHGRPGAANVARGGVDEQILAGAIEAALAGLFRGGEERVPGEAVDIACGNAVAMAHDQGDVIAGIGDRAVDEQLAYRLGHAGAHHIEHGLRGFRVTTNRADVGLDDGQGDLVHVGLPAEENVGCSNLNFCQLYQKVVSGK
jgi:hypothetical protein